MTVTPFEREVKLGRKTRTRRGVIDEHGNEYRNRNEALAAERRAKNPIHGLQTPIDYMILKAHLGARRVWIATFRNEIVTCDEMPYDKQEDVYDRMRTEGRALPRESRKQLLDALAKLLA